MPNAAIIIIPGAWHTPRHYARLVTQLSNHNYSATAVALPSVNSSPPLPTWKEDVQAVHHAITEKLDLGQDVIAIAHSFGGVAMSEAVKGLGKEERQKQGFTTGVVRLVYMCTMALPKGQTHVGQMTPVTPEEEEREKRQKEYAEKSGGMQFTDDGAILLPKHTIRDVFYNRCDPADVDEALAHLGSFPPGPPTVSRTRPTARFPERMIAQGESVFRVERCQEGHSPFLSNPELVVGCLRRAAGEGV